MWATSFTPSAAWPDLLRVLDGKVDDRPNLGVDNVHHGPYEDDFDTGFVNVFYSAKLDVEKVPDFSVAVGIDTDAVELKINIAEPALERLAAELLALGELNTIGAN